METLEPGKPALALDNNPILFSYLACLDVNFLICLMELIICFALVIWIDMEAWHEIVDVKVICKLWSIRKIIFIHYISSCKWGYKYQQVQAVLYSSLNPFILGAWRTGPLFVELPLCQALCWAPSMPHIIYLILLITLSFFFSLDLAASQEITDTQ